MSIVLKTDGTVSVDNRNITDALTQLETTVASQATSIQTLQGTVGVNMSATLALQTSVGANALAIGELQSSGGGSVDTSGLQASIDANTADIGTLQTSVGTNTTDIGALQTSVDTLDNQVSINTTDIDTLKSSVSQGGAAATTPYFLVTKTPVGAHTNVGGSFQFNHIVRYYNSTNTAELDASNGYYTIRDPGLWVLTYAFQFHINQGGADAKNFAISVLKNGQTNYEDILHSGSDLAFAETRTFMYPLEAGDQVFVRNLSSNAVKWFGLYQTMPQSYFMGYRINA